MWKTILSPRVSETDGVGHINNTAIPVWLEAGRHPLFKLFNPQNTFHDWRMVIVKTTVEYKSQIYFGEDVEIHCYVHRIGNSSLELYEEVWQQGTKCIEAYTTYVNFNQAAQKSEPISDAIREILVEHCKGGEE